VDQGQYLSIQLVNNTKLKYMLEIRQTDFSLYCDFFSQKWPKALPLPEEVNRMLTL
jgi:hypothetical protein